jgi:type VI protein secretion system component VasF
MDNKDKSIGAYAGSSSEAARARERMDAARQQGSREISGRSRRVTGWLIAMAIVAFFVAAFAGWIDIFPG